MGSWESIEPIFENIRTLLETYVTALAHNERAWIMPGLSVDNDPSNEDIRRVILGKRSYADMQFPSVYVVLTSIAFETSSFTMENAKLNFRMIVVNKSEPSLWGGVKETIKVSCQVRDALYNTTGTHNRRTLLGACNDCFADEVLVDTEPMGDNAEAIWNYFNFWARKKITA